MCLREIQFFIRLYFRGIQGTIKISNKELEGFCMGIFLNPDSSKFEKAVNSDNYIDKTGLLTYTNSVLHTMQKYIYFIGRCELQ